MHLVLEFGVGNKSQQVIGHLGKLYPWVRWVEVNSPTTNLLQSVAAARSLLVGDTFLWIGGAMFFQSVGPLKQLKEVQERTGAFCTLLRTREVRYKPKLVFDGSRLTQFIVGDHATPFSSPTCFAVATDFVEYAARYPESETFQAAIRHGRDFRVLDLNEWSCEIHELGDLFSVSSRRHPEGYVDEYSRVMNGALQNCYVYHSRVENCNLERCIVIDSNMADVSARGQVFYRSRPVQAIC